MPRTAPTNGYDFSRKRDYRRKVWATFRDRLKANRLAVADSHALLMPSLEGDEIDVALNAGFREQHLHVVDKEPAIVATLKRRYPRVNTYGVTVSRAMSRIQRDGIKLRCANLDFCGQWSHRYALELIRVAFFGFYKGKLTESLDAKGDKVLLVDCESSPESTGAFDGVSLIAVSMLRGRENKIALQQTFTNEMLDSARVNVARQLNTTPEEVTLASSCLRVLREFSLNDRSRIMYVGHTLQLAQWDSLLKRKPTNELLRAEYYLSTSGQTMLWSIWEAHTFNYSIQRSAAANAVRAQRGIPPVYWQHLQDEV